MVFQLKMDIKNAKKYAESEYEASQIMKAVTTVKNEVKNREQFSDVAKTDFFKPLIDQQKRTDEKQDKVIEQLKENQLAITEDIQDIVHLEKSRTLQPAKFRAFYTDKPRHWSTPLLRT